jgi:hypothetical protein
MNITPDQMAEYGMRVVTLIGVGVAAVKAWRADSTAKTLQVSIDGRLTQFIESLEKERGTAIREAAATAHAVGLELGRAQASAPLAKE